MSTFPARPPSNSAPAGARGAGAGHPDEALEALGLAPRRAAFRLAPRLIPHAWGPHTLHFLAHVPPRVSSPRWARSGPTPARPGAALHVPGASVPIAAAGHTGTTAATCFPGIGALFSGDALVTLDVLTGRRGQRLLPPACPSTPNAPEPVPAPWPRSTPTSCCPGTATRSPGRRARRHSLCAAERHRSMTLHRDDRSAGALGPQLARHLTDTTRARLDARAGISGLMEPTA